MALFAAQMLPTAFGWSLEEAEFRDSTSLSINAWNYPGQLSSIAIFSVCT